MSLVKISDDARYVLKVWKVQAWMSVVKIVLALIVGIMIGNGSGFFGSWAFAFMGISACITYGLMEVGSVKDARKDIEETDG